MKAVAMKMLPSMGLSARKKAILATVQKIALNRRPMIISLVAKSEKPIEDKDEWNADHQSITNIVFPRSFLGMFVVPLIGHVPNPVPRLE
jgi:hypothetical protein